MPPLSWHYEEEGGTKDSAGVVIDLETVEQAIPSSGQKESMEAPQRLHPPVTSGTGQHI